jgi:hypothetical protein
MSQGNYLELEEDIAQYEDAQQPTKIHILTQGSETISLDDPTICIIDSGTTHTILREKKYFQNINASRRPITAITGQNYIEKGHRPATIILPQGTAIHIQSAIYAPSSKAI